MSNKLGNYPERTYEELPEGEYPGKVIEVKASYSGSQKYGITIVFQVLADKYPNSKIWKTQYLEGATPDKTEMALGMFSGLLKKCGVPEEIRHELFVPIQSKQIATLLVGKTFMIKKSKSKPSKDGKIYDQIDVIECLDQNPKFELLKVEFSNEPDEPVQAESVSEGNVF